MSTNEAMPVLKGKKMPKWFPFAWSTRGISLSINIILVGYLTFYCTDMLGLGAASIGTLLLASKLVDGFTDLFAGFIVEKTHTKLGKGRPYELFIILTWIFTILMFTVPNVGTAAQYVYIFILYLLVNAISITFLNAAETVYLVNAVEDGQDRIKVISLTGSLIMICAIAINIVLPQIVNTIGAAKSGWTKIMLMFGIPLMLIGILRFLLCPEVQDTENESTDAKNSLSIKEMLGLMVRNKYNWILMGIIICVNLINNMSIVTTYYFKYIMGDISLASLPAMSSIATPFLILLFPKLSRKLGTTKVLRAGVIISIVGVGMRFLGNTNMITIVAGTALFTIGLMPITMMVQTYLIDTFDYGEWKNGKRIEGPLCSMTSFAQKVGTALASGITGIVMSGAGYNGTAAAQSSGALSAIVNLYNLCPLILLVITIVLTFCWNLDSLMPQIRKDLAERKMEGIKA